MKTCIIIAWSVALCFLSDLELFATNDLPQGTNGASLFIGTRVESRFSGTNYISEVRWLDVKDSPRWDGDGKLPLSPHDATSRANDYLKNYFAAQEIEKWHVSQIALRRWYGWDIWFYELHFSPGLNGSSLADVAVFVTMSGYVCPLREMRK